MKRNNKTLEVKAKQQISICCETLCDKDLVAEYIGVLENTIAAFERRIKDLNLEENNKPNP